MRLRQWLSQRRGTSSSFAWKPDRSPDEVIDGRRYLRGSPYILPKDLLETNRLDFQHYLMRSLLYSNYSVPLPKETELRILDVGSGTGLWMREMGRAFPQAQMVGFDIEPQGKSTFSDLPNARWVQGDVLKGLPFLERSFDYVHQRLMVAAIPANDWPHVVSELVRVTAPNGWVELLEGGHVFEHAGPYTQQFMAWWQAVSRINGFDTSLMENLGMLLREAGLHHIVERRIRVPVGKWGGHLGELMKTNMQTGFLALKSRYCRQLSISSAQFDQTVDALPDEWERCQTSYYFHLAYGQR